MTRWEPEDVPLSSASMQTKLISPPPTKKSKLNGFNIVKCFHFSSSGVVWAPVLEDWRSSFAWKRAHFSCSSSQAGATLEEKTFQSGTKGSLLRSEQAAPLLIRWTYISEAEQPLVRGTAKKNQVEPWILPLHLGTGGFSMTNPYRIKGNAFMLHGNKNSICCDIHGAG